MEDLELRGSCHKCGKCCEAIHIPISPEELEERYNKGLRGDVKFVYENWTPITKEEAFAINPYLEVSEKIVEDKAMERSGNMHYYTCKQHDKETGLCKVHDSRPHVCSGYPWYGGVPNIHEPLYTPECGYRIDIEDEREKIKAIDLGSGVLENNEDSDVC